MLLSTGSGADKDTVCTDRFHRVPDILICHGGNAPLKFPLSGMLIGLLTGL